MPPRVVVLVTSPRVPPGLLSWPAWQALHGGPVLTAAADHPQLAPLRAAGVRVDVLDRPGAVADPGGEVTFASTVHARAAEQPVWLAAPGDEGLLRALGTLAEATGVVVEVVHGSWDVPGARLLDVVALMDRLRSPGGCPWDAEQTHASLRPYLLEEAYEAYQALEDGDPVALREELGDVLLQVVFHARLAEEADPPWSVDDVAGDLVDKLVRRHPHVFAGGSADDLEGTWQALKAQEKGRTSVTDGVPLSQPALTLAATLQRRAERLGAPLPSYDGVGGRLWELVRGCRAQGLDPEVELRTIARGFRDRLAAAERAVRDEGGDPAQLTAEQWLARW